MKAEDIKDIEECRIWAVEHAANSNAWWDHQWARNNQEDEKMKALTKRVTALEHKIILIVGVASTIGGLLGGGGGRFLLSLVGN